MVKIYTKKGDSGRTTLFGGKQVEKDDLRIETNGEIDEVNVVLGLVIATSRTTEFPKKYANEVSALLDKIKRIQETLIQLGSDIATPLDAPEPAQSCFRRINMHDTALLESEIDEIETHLTPLQNFILPGGTQLSAMSHKARTLVRSAERNMYRLSKKDSINPDILPFVNRLSDWLFVVARYFNHLQDIPDEICSSCTCQR